MFILVIEPGSSAQYISDAVKRLGYQPIIFCSIDEYGGEQKKYLQKHGHYEVNCKSQSEILKCISKHNLSSIAGVLSTSDRFIPQACQVAVELGVRGMDPALCLLNNKAKVVDLIPEESPPSICFNRFSIPHVELKAMLENSVSLIFKPVKSAGAKGLFEISKEEDLNHILDYIKKEKQVNVLDQDWIVEPRIEGILYSLEGFFINRVLHVIGLSRRTRIDFTESQNQFPVDSIIDPFIYEKIKKAVNKLAIKSNYKNGYFHSEFIVKNDQTYLIDANFGRLGGSCIPRQIALSADKCIEEIYAHVIEVTLFGEQVKKDFYPQHLKESRAILYGLKQDCIFLQLDLLQAINSHHTQFIEEGKRIKPVGIDNRSIIGMLIGEEKDVQADIQKIHIHTSMGVFDPIY